MPEEVRRNGVIVAKRSNDILQVVALESGKGRYNTLFLSNYASLNIADELKRVKGVGDVTIFGAQDYSMRVWLKPDRMAQLGLTTTDVSDAIQAQNAQNAAGKIGQEPAPADQVLAYTVTAKGRLLTPEEFGAYITELTALAHWAPTATTSKSRSTASRPSPWASSSRPVPTHWKWPN